MEKNSKKKKKKKHTVEIVYGCWTKIPLSLWTWKKVLFIIILSGSVIHFKVCTQIIKTSTETQVWQFYPPCLPTHPSPRAPECPIKFNCAGKLTRSHTCINHTLSPDYLRSSPSCTTLNFKGRKEQLPFFHVHHLSYVDVFPTQGSLARMISLIVASLPFSHRSWKAVTWYSSLIRAGHTSSKSVAERCIMQDIM